MADTYQITQVVAAREDDADTREELPCVGVQYYG